MTGADGLCVPGAPPKGVYPHPTGGDPTRHPPSGQASRSAVGERHAILAVDPGGTTGVAAVHVVLYPTVRETFERGVETSKTTEVRGDYLQQAEQLAGIYDRFVYTANVEKAVALDNVHCVFENFLADPRRIGGGATDLTSIWVAAAFAGKRGDPLWQTPSQAKGYAKNDRLRSWGIWVVGSEHMRDAMRHVAYRVNQLVP